MIEEILQQYYNNKKKLIACKKYVDDKSMFFTSSLFVQVHLQTLPTLCCHQTLCYKALISGY